MNATGRGDEVAATESSPAAPRPGPGSNALERLTRVLFNVRFVRLAAQVAFVVVLIALALYFADNYQARTRAQSKGFGFLNQPAGFGITDTNFRGGNSNRQALIIGIKNTALVAVVGIPLASIVGLVVGVLRLSRNWVVQKAATFYVETFRNIPVLLVILFTAAAMRPLPRIREAVTPFDRLVISNRWIAFPSPVAGDGLRIFLGVLVVGTIGAIAVGMWRTRVSERTGVPHHRVLYGGAILLGVAVIGWVVTQPIHFSVPRVDGAIVVGGFSIGFPYMVLTLALGLYTASHIAEIVRGSILAVPKGQTEASTALGLSHLQRLRFVVLPQALRVAIPPTLNQYLSLTKNSSLAIFVAFTDVFNIAQRIINTGRPPLELFVIVMAIYLMFSLSTSLVINLVNRRFRLVER